MYEQTREAKANIRKYYNAVAEARDSKRVNTATNKTDSELVRYKSIDNDEPMYTAKATKYLKKTDLMELPVFRFIKERNLLPYILNFVIVSPIAINKLIISDSVYTKFMKVFDSCNVDI